ncbi:Retrovirus-related Pol polyprotein from transposon TNT 1-94 [Anthophora plagiata]
MSDKEFGMEIVKLDGTNYSTWKFEVVIALEAKDLFGFVDGTTVKPDEDKTTELKAYGQKSAQVKIIILSTIAQNLRRNLYNCSTAKEMWDKLKDLYGEASEDAAQTAWEQFYNFRISETEPIADQLEILESICRRLQDTGEGPSDKAVMTKLLRSLPAKFSIFRHTWECTPVTEKTKTNLISRLIKEDKWIAEDEVATLALHVQKSSLNDAKRKKRSKKDIEEMKKRTRCGVCKEKGHWARECPKRQKDQWEKPSGSSVRNAPALVCDIVETYKCTSEVNSDVWIADSGAGMHMTFRKDYFSVLQSNSNGHMVKVADDRIILAGGIGTIKIQEELEGVSYERELQDVLYVPELKCSLFSIGSINKKRYSFHSFENRCEVRDSEGKLAARGIPHGTLFKMCFKVKVPIECKTIKLADGQEKLKLWHERMGHLNIRAVKHTCEHFGIDGMENDNGINKLFCEGCVMGKQSRRPHPSMRIENNYGPGEKIHTDVCGPVNISSPSNTRFFLLFKDENTSFRKVYFLSHKTEVFEKFKEFEAFVSTQTGKKIKVLHSDNGSEYTCSRLQKFLKGNGIIHERSSPYIHEQNGRAEREIRTLVESARSMIHAKNVDKRLWTEAVNTACYVLNRTILKAGETITPFEKWFKRKPVIKHLKMFGSTAYLNIPKEKRQKFDAKSKQVIFVGYEGESTNYRLWDNDLNKIKISSDVTFNESALPRVHPDTVSIKFGIEKEAEIIPVLEDAAEHQVLLDENEENREEWFDAAVQETEQVATNRNVRECRQLRDRRNLQVPDRYGVPIAFFADTVPTTYTEAIMSDDTSKWKRAMDEEMLALEENHTWTLCALPQGKRAIGCKWVFSIKNDAAGNLKRYKARLVAKGFRQRAGIDYFDTFAPVVRYESIRILLAIAAKKDYEIMKFDVKTAFLYGDLQEEIYLDQPPGYKNDRLPDAVFKLHRSLYGLKQSPKCWNEKFTKFLKEFNLVNIASDQCVFVGVVNSSKVYLVLYVDDGLIVSENESAIKRVLNYLESNFKITVDHADEFLGFEIKRDRERRILKICQSGYIKRIIEKFNMSEANPCSVPAEPGMFLPKQTPAVEGKIPYREAIGSLLFAARVCRPDIEYAVNYASQFLSCYDDTHWQAVKKILRYLNGTRDYGIVYGNSKSPLEISGFTDADYAGCITTRKSRSGFVFILNGGPITWSSQLQKVVALSTTESEYIALAHGVKDAIWLRRMLNELDIPCNSVSVYVDNQAAIKIASNSENHKRSKHIDVKYHFTREVVNRGEIEIKYIQSKEQLADIFTKPLQKQQYCYLREKLNVNGHSN